LQHNLLLFQMLLPQTALHVSQLVHMWHKFPEGGWLATVHVHFSSCPVLPNCPPWGRYHSHSQPVTYMTFAGVATDFLGLYVV
jgi:hypothetical protein